MGFKVRGVRLRVEELGFGVESLELRIQSSGCPSYPSPPLVNRSSAARVSGRKTSSATSTSGSADSVRTLRARGSGIRVQGQGFRIKGKGLRVYGLGLRFKGLRFRV
jgi:hypothetical protein